MAKAAKKKIKTVVVHEHLRHVPVSAKNPKGITKVSSHLRHIDGKFLDKNLIKEIFLNYNKKNIIYPTKSKLLEFKNSDLYDDLIAVWVDYFNNKINLSPKIDPDMIKALIASESSFNPKAHIKSAFGLTQITSDTLKIIQNLNGEAKDFVFKDISQKDLYNPEIAIPMSVRWMIQKRNLASHKLKRSPSSDEIVMDYKGVLKDKSAEAQEIMTKFRGFYEKLKN
jgi:Transglycosylase SLT domain